MAVNVTPLEFVFEVMTTNKNRNGKWDVKTRHFKQYDQARKYVSNNVDYSTLNVILMDVDYWHFYAGDDLVKTIRIRLENANVLA